MQIAKIGGFDRILCDHDDGMIAKTIIYRGDTVSKPDNSKIRVGKAYADPERTIEIPAMHLAEAYAKGCVIAMDAKDVLVGMMTPSAFMDGILLMIYGDEASYHLPAEISIEDFMND